MKKQVFDVMDACAASALDFIYTVLFRMKEDEFDNDVIDSYKEYLLAAHEMHYNTDIGEQCENITEYLDECNYYNEDSLSLLQEEEQKIEKWLKEVGYSDECVGAGFETIDGHQGRTIDFKYNGTIDELDGLDIDKLAASIAESVIDDRFSVRVFTYDDEEYRNMFCVEVWLNE